MNTKIESFAQLMKVLINNLGAGNLPELIIPNMNLTEDNEVQYSSLPLQVLYDQIPVVVNGDVLVKVVILRQANNITIITPQKVNKLYNDLIENPEELGEINSSFDLYAEIFGFNSKDPELHRIIKNTYINAGNNLPTFELVGELKVEKEPTTPSGGDFGIPSDTSGAGDGLDSLLDELDNLGDEDIEAMGEGLEENLEAYSKFRKDTKSLEYLLKEVILKTPELVKENISKYFLDNILVLKINNKAIYESLSARPMIAKNLLKQTGELIRNNYNTQLLDSFNKDGARYFVLAEAVNNNFWVVKNEDLPEVKDKDTIIKVLDKNIIELNSSNIRYESRKFKGVKKENKILFKGRN